MMLLLMMLSVMGIIINFSFGGGEPRKRGLRFARPLSLPHLIPLHVAAGDADDHLKSTLV